MRYSESDLMLDVAKYLDLCGYLWFHPLNEGKRSLRQNVWLKQRGLKSGVPDIIVCGPRMAAIELKSPSGRLSSDQLDWLRSLRVHGWITGVARSVSDVKDLLDGKKVQLDYGMAPGSDSMARSNTGGPIKKTRRTEKRASKTSY